MLILIAKHCTSRFRLIFWLKQCIDLIRMKRVISTQQSYVIPQCFSWVILLRMSSLQGWCWSNERGELTPMYGRTNQVWETIGRGSRLQEITDYVTGIHAIYKWWVGIKIDTKLPLIIKVILSICNRGSQILEWSDLCITVILKNSKPVQSPFE